MRRQNLCQVQGCNKAKVSQVQGCNNRIYSPRARTASKGKEEKYQIHDCNKGTISQVHHRNKITHSSRVRIASERILGQMQESSKGFVSQSRNCNKSFIPPESGLQHECLFLQSQDCNIRIFGQIQESSTGFVFQLASWLAG